MPNSIQVTEHRIPIARVRALSNEQRYTYYLFGLIFNELMCLRKIISFALQQCSEDTRPVRRNPELSQVFMMFRIACAKIYEAKLKINSKDVSKVFEDDIYPNWADGKAALKKLNKAIQAATWLGDVRNGIAFHYPTEEQWRPFTTPTSTWVDDYIFAGQEFGNHFYDAADSIAKHQMFQLENEADAQNVIQIVTQLLDLLRDMSVFIDESLGIFLRACLLDNSQKKTTYTLSAPKYSQQRIPFWTEMSDFKKQR